MEKITTKTAYLVGVLSLSLGLAFNYLFYDKPAGISLLIYLCLILAVLFVLLRNSKAKYDSVARWLISPAVALAVLAAIRANEFLLFCDVILIIGLLLLLARRLAGWRLKNFLFLDYLKTAAVMPIEMLGRVHGLIGQILSPGEGLAGSRRGAQITRGLIMTLPILAIFIALFSSADLVFGRAIRDIFSFDFTISPDIIAQAWITAIITVVWLGAYAYVLSQAQPSREETSGEKKSQWVLGNIEVGMLFGALNALFLVFVAVQVRYLFAGHEAITRFGYTYAEYVHKGFGELVFAAILAFLLITISERYIERKNGKPRPLFKLAACSLIVLVLVVTASAFMRLQVYEQAYGFTLLRLLVQSFIAWLAVVFVWLGYKVARSGADRVFVFGLFLSVLAFFFTFNLINPDALAARNNIARFAGRGELDSRHLSGLSADAVPALIPLLDMTDYSDKDGQSLPVAAAVALQEYEESFIGLSWQSFNYSRWQAERLIEGRREVISNLAVQSVSNTDGDE